MLIVRLKSMINISVFQEMQAFVEVIQTKEPIAIMVITIDG